MKPWLVLLIAALSTETSGVSRAADAPAMAPVVLELFTSQGCSSCPPAEQLLRELAGRPDVLPLAFHVTYWDDLGWRDRFSIQEADARQYRYAEVLGRRGVYTPQMIVNGSRQVLGSNRTDVLKAIDTARRSEPIQLTVSGRSLRIALPELQGGCDCDVRLLGVQPSTQTAVGRGENAGRVILESSVVRQIHAEKEWDGKASERVRALPEPQAGVSQWVVIAQSRADSRVMAVGRIGG